MRRAPLAAAAASASTSASASATTSASAARQLCSLRYRFIASSSSAPRRYLHHHFHRRTTTSNNNNFNNFNLNNTENNINKRAMSTTSTTPKGPAPEALPALLASLQSRLPASLPVSAQYLVPSATLLALGQPSLVGGIFEAFAGTASAEGGKGKDSALTPLAIDPASLSLHLRDLLLKAWTLTGIPLVITAAASLAAAETRSAHKFPPTHSLLSARYGGPAQPTTTTNTNNSSNSSTQTPLPLDLTPNAAIPTRGSAHLKHLYRAQLTPILSTLGAAAADITWLEEAVIYGLFLSDDSILSRTETSLVVLCAIMGQDLKAPASWHVRGLRRLGVSKQDVEALVACVEEVAVWTDGRERGWVSWVGDVEGDLVGDEAWEAGEEGKP